MPTTVDEVIKRIASLELSNTRFSDISTSEIGQQNRVLYINAIQKALVHLYSEFDLREGWFELLPIVGRVHYPITSAASMRNNPNTGYINDIGKKTVFDDAEIMTIYSCVTSKGVPVGINDVNDPFSVFIDKYNRIQIPNPIKEGSYLFTYRAYHPKVTDSIVDVSVGSPIDLPYYLEDALDALVSFYLLQTLPSSAEFTNGASRMYQQYKGVLAEVKERMLVRSDSEESFNIQRDAGWR